MLLRHKIFYIVIFPMLLLAAYQIYTIDHTFGAIEEVRSKVFVESSKEVKYASDIQFLTGVMNSSLFELDSAFELGDAGSFDRAIRVYRETQQQRYFALQKLKESISDAGEYSFQFIAVVDRNKLSEITAIEQKLKELDGHNEAIISIFLQSRDTNTDAFNRYGHVSESIALTREIIADLAAFTNKRYIKVDETSKLVATSEKDAKSALYMIYALGYLLGGLLILFLYTLIVSPLERFARAIDRKSMDGMAWTALEPEREDEVGILYRTLNEYLQLKHGGHHAKPKKEKKSRKRLTSGKNGHGK